jgi:hypothetical protein
MLKKLSILESFEKLPQDPLLGIVADWRQIDALCSPIRRWLFFVPLHFGPSASNWSE